MRGLMGSALTTHLRYPGQCRGDEDEEDSCTGLPDGWRLLRFPATTLLENVCAASALTWQEVKAKFEAGGREVIE